MESKADRYQKAVNNTDDSEQSPLPENNEKKDLAM